MIKKIKSNFITNILIATITGILLSNFNSLASDANAKSASTQVSTNTNVDRELQKIIDDFNDYSRVVSAGTREEVKKYRVEIAKINQQKRELYKKLSQRAQNYLTKEREYKKKISLLKINMPETSINTNSNDKKSDKKDMTK